MLVAGSTRVAALKLCYFIGMDSDNKAIAVTDHWLGEVQGKVPHGAAEQAVEEALIGTCLLPREALESKPRHEGKVPQGSKKEQEESEPEASEADDAEAVAETEKASQ